METKYFYLRDEDRKPVVTVCVLKNEKGILSRGLAICSDQDNPCKEKGRKIAKREAMKANGEKKNSINIADTKHPRSAAKLIDLCSLNGLDVKFWYFREYNPVLSNYEKKLFKL